MFRVLRRKWLRDLLLTAALLAATAALVAAPSQAIEGAKNGLALCGNVIIPSLFPFFVLSSLVVDLGLRRNGCWPSATIRDPPSFWEWWERVCLAPVGLGCCSI